MSSRVFGSLRSVWTAPRHQEQLHDSLFSLHAVSLPVMEAWHQTAGQSTVGLCVSPSCSSHTIIHSYREQESAWVPQAEVRVGE